jgi:phosphate starvation-inducible protein PhoH
MANAASRRQKRIVKTRTYEEQNHLKLAKIDPITDNQRKVFELYDSGLNLLLYGTAGTGKTFLSLYLALEELMEIGTDYKKIIIVRSVVPTRDMGFLPGSAREKSLVYESPYYAISTELFGRSDAYELIKKKATIEFITSSFVRGTTMSDCIVIVDEFQNMTEEELHSVITRAGKNCKMIFCGDCNQNDLKKEQTGFYKFTKILSSMDCFGVVEFGINDIVRSGLVKEYIIKREQYETKNIPSSRITKPSLVA